MSSITAEFPVAAPVSPARSREREGVILCAISATGFGLMSVLAKIAYAHGANIVTLLSVRFVIAAVILWVLAHRRGVARVPSWKIAALVVGIGLTSYAIESELFYASLTHIDAALAELLLFSYPAMVVIAMIALRRERASRTNLTAVAVATGGIGLVLVGGGIGSINPVGASMALGAAALYTIYVLVADSLKEQLHPLTLSALVCTGAGIAFTGAGAATGSLHPAMTGVAWLCAIVIATLSTVVAFTAFLGGVARLGGGRAAIVSALEPPVTVIGAFIAFGEVLGPIQLLGGLGVVGAVVLLQMPGRIRRPWPSPSSPRSHHSSRVRARRSRMARDGHTNRSSTGSERSRSSMIGS